MHIVYRKMRSCENKYLLSFSFAREDNVYCFVKIKSVIKKKHRLGRDKGSFESMKLMYNDNIN